MRIELRDGQWAELREHITHGQDKAIKRSLARARADDEADSEVNTVAVRAFLTAWYVNDPDGNVIPVGDEDAIDRAPDDIVDELVTAAAKLYKATTNPNPSTPDSSAG